MQNRNSLFAFLIAGAVIIGLLTMFNYGLAVVGDPPEGTPTPTPTKTATPSLSIDFSSLKDGTVFEEYLGILKAHNASGNTDYLIWKTTNQTKDNLKKFGLEMKCNDCLSYLFMKTRNMNSEIHITGRPTRTGLVSGTIFLEAYEEKITDDLLQKIGINFQFYVKEGEPGPNNDLSIDISGLGTGTAGKPYSGSIKAKNAVRSVWKLGSNNLSQFGLTAPATGYGESFTIQSINSTSAKEGTATGTITLISRIGKNETDEISGEFKIQIKRDGGGSGGTIISPQINSFKVNDKPSARVTEGDEITFSWDVSDGAPAGFETSVEILGRLTPQSASDPAGQQNVCVKAGMDKCGLSGSIKVNIYRSSAFTLKAKNTLSGKSRTSTSSVYVIVKPEEKKFGTLVIEGTLDGKQYTGRVIPIINNEEKSGEDVWKLLKDGKEKGQEKVNINSLPKVFNRAVGNYKLELDSRVTSFKLISAIGKKITAELKNISPNGGELNSGGTVRFGINLKSSAAVVPKYSCNSGNACVRDDSKGTYTESNCNNACQPTTGDLTITTVSLPGAVKNTAYSQQFSATGGTEPHKWSKTSSSLPAGLKLSSDGLLFGTPTKAESKTFKIKVTDSSSSSESNEKEFNLTVKSDDSPEGTFDIKIGPAQFLDYGRNKTTGQTDSEKWGIQMNAPTGNIGSGESINYRVLFKCKSANLSSQCSNEGDANVQKASIGGCYIPHSGEYGVCKQMSFQDIPFKDVGLKKDGNILVWTYYGYGKPNKTFRIEAQRVDAQGNPSGNLVTKSIEIKFRNSSAMLDDSLVAETSEETAIVPEELEEEETAETPELALVGGTVVSSQSLIAQTLDVVDSITLPIQFYTEKFVRGIIEALRINIYTNKDRSGSSRPPGLPPPKK